MSKRPQGDGVPPLKIRVEGEDGFKPEQRLLLEQLQGEISKFHAGCAQQQKLSESAGYKRNLQLGGGGQLRYSYNNGQETLDVRLPTPEPTVEEPPVPPEHEVWDFLLIDINIPIMSTGYAVAPTTRPVRATTAAQLKTPARPDLIAVDNQDDGATTMQSTPPVLLFAGAPAATEIGTQDTVPDVQTSSLLVDIRGYPNDPVIEIDLFGFLTPLGVSKRVRAIAARHNTTGPATVLRYAGGTSTLTYLNTYHADLVASATLVSTTSARVDDLVPSPYTAVTLPESVLLDNAAFTPTDIDWLYDNQDVFERDLWYNSFLAQWADITPPHAWAGGSWTGGEDFTAFLDGMDTLTAPADASFTGGLSFLGRRNITQRGDAFWFYWTDFPPIEISHWGVGDPGTPPPVLGGYTSGAFAETPEFAQVWNTYVYLPILITTPTEANSTVAITAAAFKGNTLTQSSEVAFRWSLHASEGVEALATALGTIAWSFGRWEITADYPERVTLGAVEQDVPITQEQVPANPGDGQFLGRVTFIQAGGGFSFKPASEFA